jgi:glycosyltransferase involved in cell wall biosynthesis
MNSRHVCAATGWPLMGKDRSLVTVIIPVYNCETYLAEAIESVLAQTYRPLEIIVVDDGSTDSTPEVARRFQSTVEYHRQTHRGVGAARNTGLNLAQRDYVAFLDADDLWRQDKLARQVAALHESRTLDMVFAHVEHFVSPEVEAHVAQRMSCPSGPMPGYCASSMLARRDALQRAGPFQENLRVAEFVEWYSRATDAGLVSLMLPATLVRRRIHGGNLTIRERGSQPDYLRVLKASMDRHRRKKDSGPGHTRKTS